MTGCWSVRAARRRGVWIATVACLIVAVLASPAVAAPAGSRGTAGAAPVVVLGVPDLRWEDVQPAVTPTLWRLAGRSSIAAMTDQSGEGDARRAAGWLTLNTGSRARANVPATVLPDPAFPTDLAAMRAANRSAAYHSQVGALGDALHRAGLAVAAVGGPGAVLGAMDGHGTVDVQEDSVAAALQHADVVVVELPQLYDAGRQDAVGVDDALASIDAGVEAALRALPVNASLLVAGVSDAASGWANLHVAIATGPRFGAGLLTSPSTGRTGVVQLIDVAPTVLWLTGAPVPSGMLGVHWNAVPDQASTAARRSHLVDLDRRSQTQIAAQRWYYPAVILLALLYAAATVVAWARRTRLPSVVHTVVAAVPAASFLAQLVPWWRAGSWPLAPLTVAFAGVIGTAAALAPWSRDRWWRVAGLIGAVTAAVIVLDAGTGSPLSLDAPFGDNPIIAGRFHGIGNVAFALLGTGTLILSAAVATRLRGGRAAAAVFGLGAVAVVVDGHPALGDDFGGVVALLPAVAVLGLVVSRVRLAARHLLAALGATLATASAFALYDYSRPPSERTHLGRFIGQVTDGSAGSVVARKLHSSLATFSTGWPRWIVLVWLLLAVVAYVAQRQGRLRLRAGADLRTLGGLVAALLVLAVLGAGFNDSGLAVTAFVLYVAVPLLAPVVEPVAEAPVPSPRGVADGVLGDPGFSRP